MRITEKLFSKSIAAEVERRIPAIREEVIRTTAMEATAADEASYAFSHLSSVQTGYGQLGLPEVFKEQAIRDSHWQYETHGYAYLIVSRIISIIFEGGLQYTLTFDDAVPANVQSAIRKRLQSWWDSEDTDLQDRAQEFVLECLLSGEHGWRMYVDPDNGEVSLSDLPRMLVGDIHVSARDPRRIGAVVTKALVDVSDSKEETLAPVRLCADANKAEYKHLSGDVLYYRLDTRSSKKRGSPVLQRVVDELKAEKRFRVLSTDRTVERMKTFVSVTLEGYSDKQILEYANTQRSIPTGVWYGNEKVKRQFESANVEAGEIVQMTRTLITIIMGSFGMPISWAGFGDGSTKATSETQQEPAAKDSRRMKRGIFGVYEKTMYFVADQFIVHNPQVHPPLALIETTDADGAPAKKLLRECMTIKVAPVPLEEEKPDGDPLEATTAAVDLVAKDDLRFAETQRRLFTDETLTALINYALARDGVGITIDAADVKQGGAEGGAV